MDPNFISLAASLVTFLFLVAEVSPLMSVAVVSPLMLVVYIEGVSDISGTGELLSREVVSQFKGPTYIAIISSGFKPP